MPYPYITPVQAKLRLGAYQIRALDTPETLAELIADASAQVAGALRSQYPLAAVEANTPREVVRITLDGFVALCRQRYPEVFRTDWEPYARAFRKDLDGLRTGANRLDVEGSPEPAANAGQQSEFIPDNDTSCERTFVDGFGDF